MQQTTIWYIGLSLNAPSCAFADAASERPDKRKTASAKILGYSIKRMKSVDPELRVCAKS